MEGSGLLTDGASFCFETGLVCFEFASVGLTSGECGGVEFVSDGLRDTASEVEMRGPAGMRDSGFGHVVLRDTGSGLDVSGGSGFEGLPNFGLSAMAVSSAK